MASTMPATTVQDELKQFLRDNQYGDIASGEKGERYTRLYLTELPRMMQGDYIGKALDIHNKEAMFRVHGVDSLDKIPKGNTAFYKDDGLLGVALMVPQHTLSQLTDDEAGRMLETLQAFKARSDEVSQLGENLNNLAGNKFRFHPSYIKSGEDGKQKQLVFSLSVPPGEYDSIRNSGVNLETLPIKETVNAAVGKPLFKEGKLESYDREQIYITEADARNLAQTLPRMSIEKEAFKRVMENPAVAAKAYMDRPR